MKKLLQISIAFILIILLAYFCFLDISTSIKNDLVSKAEAILNDNNITRVTVEIEGKDLEMTRVLILRGIVETDKKKKIITTLAENINGVIDINNQIIVKATPIIETKLVTKPSINKATNKATVTTLESKPPVEVIVITKPSVKITSKTKQHIEPTLTEKPPVVIPTSIIHIPTVPKAIQDTVTVPSPVQVINPPIAEENKLKGVE